MSPVIGTVCFGVVAQPAKRTQLSSATEGKSLIALTELKQAVVGM